MLIPTILQRLSTAYKFKYIDVIGTMEDRNWNRQEKSLTKQIACFKLVT